MKYNTLETIFEYPKIAEIVYSIDCLFNKLKKNTTYKRLRSKCSFYVVTYKLSFAILYLKNNFKPL